MNERIKELTAMGSSAYCHPCMDHHLAKCDGLGVDRTEMLEAVQVGLMVSRVAGKAIRRKAREPFGDTAIAA